MDMHSSSVMPATEEQTAVAVKEAMMLSEFFPKAQQHQHLSEIPFSYIPPAEILELLQNDMGIDGLQLFSPEDCARKCTSAYEIAYPSIPR